MGIVILFWMFFGCVLDGFSDYNCPNYYLIYKKHIQEIRECKNTFSRALTEVLNSNSLPNGVVEFCQMEDCRLEKETKQWVWLSYYNCYTHNQRVTQKFRNVYDFSFIRR